VWLPEGFLLGPSQDSDTHCYAQQPRLSSGSHVRYDYGRSCHREVSRAGIGTKLVEPNIDYATMAKGYGMQGIGPITDPADIAPALKRAVEIVKSGEPVLIDIVTQGR
jgi:thiamine pyrophosphate-dependent acetolactate synthase large subunit-like protein